MVFSVLEAPAVPGSAPAVSVKAKLVLTVPCPAGWLPSLLSFVAMSVPTAVLANGIVPPGATRTL